MENVKTVVLTQSVPVAVLGTNSARKGYKIENLHVSNAVLVRGRSAPAFTAGIVGVRHLRFSATPTTGTFKIRFTNLQTGATVTTAAIAAGASNATVQTAVRLLSGYSAITVGNPDSGIGYKLTLTSAPIPEHELTVEDSTLAVGGTAEVQTLSISNDPGSDTPNEGTYRIKLKALLGNISAIFQTAPIAYNAAASAVEAILRKCFLDEALTVSGALTSGLAITFGVVEPKQLIEVSSTIGNAGDPEIQTVSFSAVPGKGSFKLSYNGTKSTSIAYGASSGTVQTALRTITALASVTVTGDFGADFVVAFVGVDGDAFPLVATDNTLEAAVVTEIQSIFYNHYPIIGQYKLKYGATKTAFINNDATGADVQAALRLISGLEDVTVSRDEQDNDYTDTITFEGLVGDASLLEVTDNTLEAYIDVEIQHIAFSTVPDEGQYKLQYGATKTAFIDFTDDVTTIQTKLRAIPAISGIVVAGDYTEGFNFSFAGVHFDATALLVTDNTLETSNVAVTAIVTTPTPGLGAAVETEVAEETPGSSVTITIEDDCTLVGGKKSIVPDVARTTPGVAAVAVTSTPSVTTVAESQSQAVSVAGGATLDRSTSEQTIPVYVLAEGTGVSVKVTEVF